MNITIKNPKVSLIVVTLNRRNELIRLLDSLTKSHYKNFEVIIVDQNGKGFLQDIILQFHPLLKIKHILSETKGAAFNRNVGLGYVEGEILNFPDDDCFFDNATIENAVNLIQDFDVIGGRVICPFEKDSSLVDFPTYNTKINIYNFYKCTIEFSMFWKREKFENLGFFDEKLGVGTYFGSEEGADLVIRALKRDFRLYYFSELIFFHENQKIKNLKKVYSYALGHGAFIRKHLLFSFNHFFILYSIKYVFSSILGIVLYLFSIKKREVYFERLKGVVAGFIESKNIYKK